MTLDGRKDDTLKVRIDAGTIDMMEKARTYLKLDKSKFIRESVRQMAQAILAEHEQTRFSVEDWHAFFDMLDNPPKPTERMRKAALKYREIIHENEV